MITFARHLPLSSARQPLLGGFIAARGGTALPALAGLGGASFASGAVVGPFPRKRRGRLSLPLRRR